MIDVSCEPPPLNSTVYSSRYPGSQILTYEKPPRADPFPIYLDIQKIAKIMSGSGDRSAGRLPKDDVEQEEKENLIPSAQNEVTQALGMPAPQAELLKSVGEFALCFLALQASYLTWGMMQESIMNTTFNSTPLTPSGKFPSAVFCVFSNRILAIIASAGVVYWKHKTLSLAAPLLAFTPCALSNTVSSWSQYEALLFVSFALQTIFKSIKILPVMFMGRVLKGTKYETAEYVEAGVITLGVTMFSLSKASWVAATPEYEFYGVCLLCLYVMADSFTSQWQSKVYKDYTVDSFQMMYGVNVSASIITCIALVFSGELTLAIEFLQYNPLALYYNIITAVCSSTGQFVIYYIIKRYGPVVFTIMMTTRQMLSIIISNYYFGHKMSIQSILGCVLVFGAILFSSYRQMHKKKEVSASKDRKADATGEQRDNRVESKV
eukprot:gene37528-45578_t